MLWIWAWNHKVEVESIKSLQVCGRCCPAGVETFGFISNQLHLDLRTHAGQTTLFNSLLCRCVSHSPLLPAGTSFQKDSEPRGWPPSTLAPLLRPLTSFYSLGSGRNGGLQCPRFSTTQKRWQLWSLQVQNGLLLWLLLVQEERLQSLRLPSTERWEDLRKLPKHLVLHWGLQILHFWPGTGLSLCFEPWHPGPRPAVSSVRPQPQNQDPEPEPVE